MGLKEKVLATVAMGVAAAMQAEPAYRLPDKGSFPAMPGRVSGVAAAKRAARKRKNRRR